MGRAGFCSLGGVEWNGFEKCANHSMKVRVPGEFVIPWNFTWLGCQMLRSPRGPIFPFASGNDLRIEWTCTVCFPYLGLWKTGLHLGFGSKHIHASRLTKEFGFGFNVFGEGRELEHLCKCCY